MIELIDSPKKYLLQAFDSSVGVWRFRDNLNDSSGNNNHLSSSSAIKFLVGTTEPNNTSVLTNFVNPNYLYRSAASATDFDFNSEDFSVEYWFKTDFSSASNILGKGSFAGGGWYHYYPGNGTLTATYEGDSITTTEIINDNKWHYIAMTFKNNDESHIYIDGRRSVSKLTAPDISENLSADFKIGYGGNGWRGEFDDILIHKGLLLDSAQIKERYKARKDLRTFARDSKNIAPYHQKYTKPLTQLKFSNSVYNVRSYGIKADWQVFSSNSYSTVYSGRTDKIKFYYGLGRPETLVGYNSNPQWKVNYTGFFKPPIDGNYTFKIAGSGRMSYSIDNEGTTQTNSNIIKSFNQGSYLSTTVAMLGNSAYAFDFGYEYLKNEESGLVVLWQTDSASVTPDAVVLSGGVCNPADNNSIPPLLDIPHYSDPKLSINEDGVATLKFSVPFVQNSDSYGAKGYIYDTTNACYYDTNNPLVRLKEYRYIEYYEGYQSNNEDETIRKFTGQIRDINTNYSKSGDTLEITCNDFSIFTRDAINIESPTPIDYWQAGYIVEDFGRVNGETKPKTFDGWEPHKVYEIILTESYIDPYSIIQRKESLNLSGFATTAGFFVEPYGVSNIENLPTNKKYGIAPIGEYNSDNTDEKYAYNISTGEYYYDAINKIFKSWYYRWGVNRYGFPYLTRIHVPSSFVNSPDFSYVGGWEQSINVSAFKGTYEISTAQGYSTAYVYKDLTNLMVINAYSASNISINRTTLTLDASSASASDVGFINFNVNEYTARKDDSVLVNFYSTNAATGYLNASTWPLLDSTRVDYGNHNYEFSVNDAAFGRARTLGLEVVVPAGDRRYISLTALNANYLKYNPTDATIYVENGYATTTVTGRKFALMVGRGPSCGSSDPTVKTFQASLFKGNNLLVSTSVNTYDTLDSFYYDNPNADGLNKSYIPLANGLPYDTYNIKILPLSTSYQTRLEGVLCFAEDYEIPVYTFHTNDNEKQGSVSKLNVTKSSKDHRNDVVVLGKRKGTLVQTNEKGVETAVNPNNETTIYVQSAVRDLSSIYNSSSLSYIGRPRTTIIVDPAILNKTQADFIALNFIKEYGLPERNPKFESIGNPIIEINDCINVKEDWKNGISTNEYVWITNINSSFKQSYTTSFDTTPVKLINSYWKRPAIDIDAFGGNYIYNLHIKNRGYWTDLYADITNDTALYVNNSFTSTAYAEAISETGYLRIGTELMKYEYSSVAPLYIKFGELSRGLGEDGLVHRHWENDDVIIGYNPYSYSQGAPTVSFDLLEDANVAVHIKSLKYTDGELENVQLDDIKVDALTNIEGDLDIDNYEFLRAGHYELVWGGFDRRGEYNNNITPYEVDMSDSQFYANLNYNLPYSSGIAGAHGVTTKQLIYGTAFGLFYSEIKVIPTGKESPYIYSSLGGVSSSYVLDSAGINSTIKQILNDAGTVDLQILNDGMRVIDINGVVQGYNHVYNNAPSDSVNRVLGHLETIDTAANHFPTAYPPGITNWKPTFMWSEANPDTSGNAQGFVWKLNNYTPANHSDIKRVFLPTLQYKIVQLCWYQHNGAIKYFAPEITQDVLNKHYAETLVFDKEYYFNIQRVLSEENKEFIPEKARLEFIANNDFVNDAGAPMGVTNYTVFLHTLYDLSGRKPKQRRTYTVNRDPNISVVKLDAGQLHPPDDDNVSKIDDASVVMYYLQRNYWDAPVPFTYTGSTSNRGMYENLGTKKASKWKYHYHKSLSEGYVENTLTHYNNHVNEFKHDQNSAIFGLQEFYSNDWTVRRTEMFGWGLGRDNYVVWMDEKKVKEVIQYDFLQSEYHVENLYQTYWNIDLNVPLIWARFTRSDFGDV